MTARSCANQILAVSLPHSPLAPDQQKRSLRCAATGCSTSNGLRSLAAGEVDYQPHYTGDPRRRDGAYHQGTVWAWLLGHYALAEYRVHSDADLTLQRLGAMRDHLFDTGSEPSAKSSMQNRRTSRAARPPRPGPSLA